MREFLECYQAVEVPVIRKETDDERAAEEHHDAKKGWGPLEGEGAEGNGTPLQNPMDGGAW